ncbi:MAG: hypothetical protein D6711_01155 [Chloroflexi bacterium]|nr:MAG: hypothetical protein D6711_01155 [Chloroflexota bacterium]
MKKVIILLLLSGLLACSLASSLLSLAAPRIADTAVSYASQPDSAIDLIAQQRELELARQHRTSLGWWFAGLMMLVALVYVAVVGYRYISADYLKQRRLLARQQHRPARPSMRPPLPTVADAPHPADVPRITRTPHVPTPHVPTSYVPPALPAGGEEDWK